MLDKIKIQIFHFEKKYLLEEMIKIFLRPDQYVLVSEDYVQQDGETFLVFNKENFSDKNQIKRQIYDQLSALTGVYPQWGILTGIRPVKLTGEIYEKVGSENAVLQILMSEYYLTEEKAKLLIEMYFHQQRTCGKAVPKSAGVYIGIPFCPTRCVYCSFASNQVAESEIARYFEALLKEITYVGRRMQECGITAETIYIGGGTPTTLSAEQLRILLQTIKQNFDLTALRELTVEAGRPDTITSEKLMVLKEAGVDRISINPQSMHEKTLERIGRNHKPEDIISAFEMAKKHRFNSINADLIAGLPDESAEDFARSLKEIIALGPDNITVHCLAVKRASRLVDIDKDFHYKQADLVSEQLSESRQILKDAGYIPYYLYRQKHMAGAFENTGYCKKDKDCIYNVRIMDEHQTIIALGAGGITKVYYPEENRLERVPNVTNYQEYIARIEEMLDRKEKNLFMEVEKWQS